MINIKYKNLKFRIPQSSKTSKLQSLQKIFKCLKFRKITIGQKKYEQIHK